MTRKEVARVEKLIEEADLSQDSIPDVIRRIMRELPHLTARDIAEVARVQAETLRMKGAEIMASGEAAEQIGDIILETERLSGTAVPNLETALPILVDRAAKGDQQAANLLEKFRQAALVGMGQVEWEHLEDKDYDDEAAELEARGKLRAAWRAELSADIVAQPSGTELTPDQRAVLGGDQSSTRRQ